MWEPKPACRAATAGNGSPDSLPAPAEQWAERVACFADKKNRLDCTRLLCREPGTEQILRSLGYEEEQINRLRAEHVI
jgi:hypothetical protein